MIKADKLSKSYEKNGKQLAVIDSFSLNIPAGDFLTIVGPSGSGKSTLLLMLGGMLTPSKGRIEIENDSLYDLTIEERARLRQKKIGFVFQTFHLVPYLTALQNVQLPLMLTGHSSEAQRVKAEHLFERVGLKDRMGHYPSELSVGQQQRVALARMLANDPAIILADEPTGNLDPKTAGEVVDFLFELNQENRTVVLVTHDHKIADKAKRTVSLG
jgi:putative ABC transport system ATP-binding protein